MNEERIILPDFLIADLYKNSLVDFGNQSTKTVKEKETKNVFTKNIEAIKFLGENGKKIVIAVQHNEEVFLPATDLEFLTNILKACMLNLSDIAIINIAKQPVNFTHLKEEMSASKILLFAVKPSDLQLPFSIPNFQVQSFDGCSIMVSPALAEMNTATKESKDLKTQLWTSLKRMFEM